MPASQQQQLSSRTQAAVQHLHRLKPLDGYAVERYLALSGRHQVRLKRRGVPVHDEGFEEIVIDRTTGNVIGVQVITSRGDVGRGLVLVDKYGKLRREEDGVSVTVQLKNTTENVSTGSGNNRGGTTNTNSQRSPLFSDPTRQNNRRATPPDLSNIAATTLSDANNEVLIQYFIIALGILLALKIIYSALNVLAIILVPVVYLYAAANCPNNNTFDAKKELKRVMRGAHLPEEQKPKGFFEQGLSRLAASVTTELATSLGYEISLTDVLGAAKLACVKVPVANAEFYWMGIFGKWRYIGQRELPRNLDD